MDRLTLVKRLSHRLPYVKTVFRADRLPGYTVSPDGVAYVSNGIALYSIRGLPGSKSYEYVGNHNEETFRTLHKIILEKDVLNNYNSLSGPLEAWEELLTGTRNLLKIASHSKNTAVWFSVLKSPNNRNNWAYPYVDRKNLKRSFYDSRLIGHTRSDTTEAGIGIGARYLRDVLLIARRTGTEDISLRWYDDRSTARFDLDFNAQAFIGPVVGG